MESWESELKRLGIEPNTTLDGLGLLRLDQLLEEIERKKWEWELGILTINDGRCYMIDIALGELIKTDSEEWKSWTGDTPEEAAGKALLWLLRREARENGKIEFE